MYVLERIRSGGEIISETSANYAELLKKLYECDPRDCIKCINEGTIRGALVISVSPRRSEGRYLYKMPDKYKMPA